MQSNASIVVQNQMKRELQQTADGSHTLFIPEMDEHYHSVNGAVQESRHVFIEAGLHHQAKKDITVFEIGFGTGLNAFLTLLDAEENNRSVNYYSKGVVRRMMQKAGYSVERIPGPPGKREMLRAIKSSL